MIFYGMKMTIAISVSLLVAFKVTTTALCGSYTVTIYGDSYFPLAWSFQDQTVANAFPNPDEGTRLFFWDPDNGWSVNTYEFGEWSNGQFVIKNGTGFYYQNPTSQVKLLTVSGTDLTVTSKTFNYQAGKWHLVGYAFLQPASGINCVECVTRPEAPEPYMSYSLGFDGGGSYGDIFYTWVESTQTWSYAIRKQNNCSDCPGSPFWEGSTACAWSPGCNLSPQVPRGHAFWLIPAVNRTWTHHHESDLPGCTN